jgi:LysR family transcriptional regulator, benzoate and cis,cis-muconate-responsive activator of ben and cat genes
MEMELRHLRYFVTVATERSFSRASEKLHIAQPPLSRQIQQLEAELGVQLLHRGRPLTLTEPGRYFFEQALQVLQRADAIPAMIRRIGTGKRRQFGIGFVESTLNEQLPELIRRFRLTAPNVEIVLLDLTTLEQTNALKEGRIDILRVDIAEKALERFATSDKTTIVFERQPDGKMRVASGSWNGEKIFL